MSKGVEIKWRPRPRKVVAKETIPHLFAYEELVYDELASVFPARATAEDICNRLARRGTELPLGPIRRVLEQPPLVDFVVAEPNNLFTLKSTDGDGNTDGPFGGK